MKSLKVKLTSALIMVFVAIAMLIVGIYAAQTQTITMQGSVNFEIDDKCLYVQDVRMQEDNNTEPYSLKEQGRFMPGYVNGNFNMNLGTFTNTYGSFAWYFDIINTMDETSGETFAYTVKANTTQSGVTVGVSILDNNNSSIEQIPQGTVKPSQITQDTTLSASVKVTISAATGTQVDLSQITVTINQYVPKVYSDYSFTVDEETKTATLTKYSGTDSVVVIPSTISRREDGVFTDGSDYVVTAIADASSSSNSAFYGVRATMTEVHLPNTLTRIGDNAFYNCSSLESVTIPDSVTSIGSSAFYNCSSLTNINIPDGVTSIGDNTFNRCSSLTGDLVIPDSVTSIGYNAFYNCSSLESVTIPDGVTSIGSSAFYNCSSLTSINIPDGVTSIGRYAFSGCSNLTSVTIPDNVTSIGDGVFNDCSSLTSVTIPDNVTSIGDDAFFRCSSLTSVTIPDNVTSIGDDAFSRCSSLTSVDMSGCANLTSIGSYAFNYCSNLTSVTIPDSVTSIGDGAFSNCTSLTSVTFNTSYTWEIAYFSNFSSIEATLTSEQVKVNALEYLKNTYYNCYWRAKV